MVDVSNRLRAARERAGLEIEDIAATTKIKVWQLQAIERGEFERLPGEFFTRAFLRNYAREVRLPPDEIVREYEASRGEAQPATETTVQEPARHPRSKRVTMPVVAESDEHEPRGWALLPSPRSAWPVLALAVILLMVISMMNREPAGAGEAGAVSTSGSTAASPQPSPTSGRQDPTPEILRMEISPAAEIWVNATADGERAVYRIVRPGERVKIEARNELSFRIGNAAAFQYSINGVPGRILGGQDEVREFQVTRDNVRTYYR